MSKLIVVGDAASEHSNQVIGRRGRPSLEDKKLREQIRAITGANLSASSPDRLTNASTIFHGVRFDAMTIENRKSPYRHCRGTWRDGLQMGVESEQDHLQSHLSGPRAHRGASGRGQAATSEGSPAAGPRIGEHRARRRHFRSVFCSKALQQTTALEQFSRLTCTA
jgi:hypothetical protein